MKETRELVKFILDLGEGLAKSLEDKKVSFADAMYFVEATKSLMPAFQGFGKIFDELCEYDDDQKAELVAFIKEDFDIPQDDLEEKIESAVAMLLSIGWFIANFFKKK